MKQQIADDKACVCVAQDMIKQKQIEKRKRVNNLN